MAPAEKNTGLDWLLYQYVRYTLRNRFHNVLIRGLANLQQLPTDRPVIAFSNHSNWWDGLVVFLLTRSARQKNFYCMMDEKQLEAYHFLTWVGAFSLDVENPLRAAGAVRYAVRLLQKRTTLLWTFPQGEIAPPHKPIELRNGANYLATQANGALMLPVAFRYEFFREDKPHVLIEVGQPFPSVESSDERIAAACAETAQRLHKVVGSQNVSGFEELLGPPLSLAKRWEWLCLALRGRLAEFSPRQAGHFPDQAPSSLKEKSLHP